MYIYILTSNGLDTLASQISVVVMAVLSTPFPEIKLKISNEDTFMNDFEIFGRGTSNNFRFRKK